MLHQIGIGTLGPVFRTYEPTRDRLVAVKVFRLDIVPEQAQVLAAALSRASHAELVHPSIVEPIEAGIEGTLAFRAEEYVAAESLDVAMRHYAPASIEKVLPFITQLAGAIDFARKQGIGHGGLHPRDIFVTPDQARATGFGVVEALEQVGIRAPVRRPYSAPERIDGSSWGTAADVFSLAAITFELLTAKRPSGTGAKIGALPVTPVSAVIHAVLARAMDDDPTERHPSAAAFAGALDAAARGLPVTAVLVLPAPASALPASVVPTAIIAAPHATGLDFEASDTGAETEDDEPVTADLEAPSASEGLFPAEATLEAAARPTDRDPLHDTLDRMIPAVDLDGRETRDQPGERNARDHAATVPRFADDFAEPVARAPIPVEAPMFGSVGSDADLHDADRSRPALLPYAVTLVLGLLAGFAGGYFVGNRDRFPTAPAATKTSAAPTTPASGSPSAATGSGLATGETPRQYSDQRVTPAPAAATPPASSPSVVREPKAEPAPRREPPAATRGEIIVTSVPKGAGVSVNKKWRGRTPLTLDNVPFGAYVVRIVQPGYLVTRDEFTLSARAASHTSTARLVRAPAPAGASAPAPAPVAPAATTGTLYIDSRPRGANVTVDGRAAGQTPVTLEDVSPGPHEVRIEMDGKKTVTASPRVVAGKQERITVSLEDKEEPPAAERRK